MDTYWYLSAEKLRALGALDQGPFQRLSARGNVGIGPASLEVGLDGAAARGLSRSAQKADRQLKRRGDVLDVAQFQSGPPPSVYFDSTGPTCRAVIEEMFWVATLHGSVAVLLVGSAANAVAARPMPAQDAKYGPTADPVGALRKLQQHLPRAIAALSPDEVFGSGAAQPLTAARRLIRIAGEVTADRGRQASARSSATSQVNGLASAWHALLTHSMDQLGDDIAGWPHAHSVSQYVARHHSDQPASGQSPRVTSFVFGTPIYVSQVTQPR